MPSEDDLVKGLLAEIKRELEELRQEVRGSAPDRLLTTKEAAEYLHISERALRMQAYRGSIPFERMGKRGMRFRKSDLVRKK